jgi:hypothetical protein
MGKSMSPVAAVLVPRESTHTLFHDGACGKTVSRKQPSPGRKQFPLQLNKPDKDKHLSWLMYVLYHDLWELVCVIEKNVFHMKHIHEERENGDEKRVRKNDPTKKKTMTLTA